MPLKDRIKQHRLAAHLTLEDVAKKIGISKQTVQKYESGVISNIPSDKIENMAKLFGCSPAELMGWEDSVKSKSQLSKEAEQLLREFSSCPDSTIKEHVINILRALNQMFNENREISAFIDLMPKDIYRREYDLIEVSNYLKGMYTNASVISALASKIPNQVHANIIHNTLEFHKQHEAEKSNNIIPLRISEQAASAGHGAYLGPESFRIIDVLENDMTHHAGFAVPVSGDSMEPKYHDGDILLIVSGEPVEKGEIGLFTLDGCGYIKKLGDGELISLNPDYDPIPLDESIICNGKVIGVLPQGWIIEK